jgi:diguanylate cyclase (GGDEF)-like protein/PAS domain S-box-containing protein
MKQKTKILVVDDDPNLRKTLADILRVKGYEIAVAANGTEAIAKAEHETFSLALIDLMLPDIGGLEVMARIKASSPLTEAIILTGHASMDTAIKATGQGAFSYVLKPYQMDDLLLDIRHGVEHQQAQEEIIRLASFPRLHPSPVIEVNASGEVTFANPIAEQLFPDLTTMGRAHPLLKGLPSINELRQDAQLTEVIREVEISTKNGQATYELHTYCIPGLDLIRIYVLDITQRKLAEADLRIAAAVFESHEGMTVTDANMAILKINPTFTKITGYSAEEAIGNNPSLLKSDRHDTQYYADMWNSINTTGSWEGEIWNRRKSGEIYPEYIRITAVKDNNGKVTNYVGAFNDITVSKTASDEIKNLAFFDPLTGLPNRRLLTDRLKQAFASSARSGQHGALLFIDLDNFKILNDTLGHDMGDLLLQQAAQRLGSCIREGDTVARLGGDEFVIMLEDLSKNAMEAAEQTKTVGEKIIAALNLPYQLTKHAYHGTPSIGATLFRDHQLGIDELFKQADIAMYQAKKAGRNTLCFFDPQMQDIINARAVLENELRIALEKRQFHLYYQIQVDNTQHPLGAEALIRWMHPERGLVSPSQFIPLADETGMILPIGQWVLETACAQLKAWEQNATTRNLILSVNVSAKQFRQVDFVMQIHALVHRYAINPKLLKLELTESLLVENVEEIISTMNALHAIGIQFSLDDFGTGYSSLQYLKRLPLNQLKIDQSFVRDLAIDSNDKAIVRTIIAMAQSLNMNVIAEGVETEEQRQLLLDNGCTHYQGYLFGMPVPIEQFEMQLTGMQASPAGEGTDTSDNLTSL